MNAASQKIERYISKKYGVKGDFPFPDDYDAKAFRHPDNRKWFALMMDLPNVSSGILEDFGPAVLLNLKLLPSRVIDVIDDHTHPAYHMNRKHWVSVLLNATTDLKKTEGLIDESFHLTEKHPARKKHRDDF